MPPLQQAEQDEPSTDRQQIYTNAPMLLKASWPNQPDDFRSIRFVNNYIIRRRLLRRAARYTVQTSLLAEIGDHLLAMWIALLSRSRGLLTGYLPDYMPGR